MTSIDLYGDFNDELDAQAGYDEEQGDNDQQQSGDVDGDGENKEAVDAKVKVVRIKRKLFTLNVERLKGPRGIVAVDDFFKDIKFKGKGYENQDLDEVMKRLEHWAHRMYPKYNFDDSLAAIDRLGKKKEINVHMDRYRRDQLKEDERILSDGDDAEGNKNEGGHMSIYQDEPIDEFEALIDEQIALTTVHSRTNVGLNKSFGNISSISNTTTNGDYNTSSGIFQPPLSSSQRSQETSSQFAISEDIRVRIAENKRKALAILAQRKKQEEENRRQEELVEKQQFREISNIIIDDDY